MALTHLQRRVCRLLADRRIEGAERYVRGGTALNAAPGGGRISRDDDLFHDTDDALAVSSEADLATLRGAGLSVELRRSTRGFVEARVVDGDDDVPEEVEVQWVRDSAFRFFPLLEHPELGLTLHPFDLATNKVLALVGRVVVRDWIDILTCHSALSPLGCLAWAATGKDPGLGPRFVLEEASRTAHYPAAELEAVAFEGPRPSHAELTRRWRAALTDAHEIVSSLPADDVGHAVLDAETLTPWRGEGRQLPSALASGRIRFHAGSIGGAFPTVTPIVPTAR